MCAVVCGVTVLKYSIHLKLNCVFFYDWTNERKNWQFHQIMLQLHCSSVYLWIVTQVGAMPTHTFDRHICVQANSLLDCFALAQWKLSTCFILCQPLAIQLNDRGHILYVESFEHVLYIQMFIPEIFDGAKREQKSFDVHQRFHSMLIKLNYFNLF